MPLPKKHAILKMNSSLQNIFYLHLSKSDNKSGQLLRDNGISHDTILEALKEVRGTQRVTSQNPEETYQSLKKYGQRSQ